MRSAISRLVPERSISAATTSAAIESARTQPGGQDDEAGDRRADEGVEVGEDVLVRALDVQAACGWRG